MKRTRSTKTSTPTPVMALLQVLLDPPDGDDSGIVTLADLGIDDGGALDLWQAVCAKSSANARWARRSILTCSIRQ